MIVFRHFSDLPDELSQQLLAFSTAGQLSDSEIGEVAVALKQHFLHRPNIFSRVIEQKNTPRLHQPRGM
ncbi:hypothetical protein [Paracoccus sp. (in: a-proteobacteria)]|uniref:hypothetical protein n=1 Tax=Paracoccus sp. TaxID=267 RepID=UPI003A882A12